MALITWEKRLETGNARIDEQHRALIDTFNKLHAAMKQGKGRDEIGPTLTFLKDYTIQHFKDEEGLMLASRYPHAHDHKRVHEDFVRKVDDVVTKFQAGQPVMTMQLMDFIEGWLVEHILGEDQRLGQHLAAKVLV